MHSRVRTRDAVAAAHNRYRRRIAGTGPRFTKFVPEPSISETLSAGAGLADLLIPLDRRSLPCTCGLVATVREGDASPCAARSLEPLWILRNEARHGPNFIARSRQVFTTLLSQSAKFIGTVGENPKGGPIWGQVGMQV